jgi:hypothetical protein
MAESDSSDEETFSTSRFRAYLKTLRSQLDESIEILEQFVTVEKPNRISHPYPLTPAAQDFFKQKEASLEELAQTLIQIWKKDGRFGLSGRTVRLTEQEAALFQMTKSREILFHDWIRYLSKLQILKKY